MKFMVGLDDSFNHLRSQLLLQKPIPTLSQVYSMLLQEESQRSIFQPVVNNPMDSAAMVAKSNGSGVRYQSYQKEKPRKKCQNCGMTNHTQDTCFQLIGFPPGWKNNKNAGKRAYANVVEGYMDDNNAETSSDNPIVDQVLF